MLFVDEIHRLNRAVEEILYPALEDFRLDIVVGQGPAARTLTLDLPPFTLVGATTRTGLLTTPLRDRFGMTFRLEYYDRRGAGVDRAPLGADPRRRDRGRGARVEIARRARGTPRIANRILRRVRDVAQVRHDGAISLAVAREALDAARGGRAGPRAHRPRAARAVVEQASAAGPVGLSTLAVALGEEPDTIEDVYEPYLLQLGFLQRTPRGRIVTELGRERAGATVASSSLFPAVHLSTGSKLPAPRDRRADDTERGSTYVESADGDYIAMEYSGSGDGTAMRARPGGNDISCRRAARPAGADR